MTGVDQEPASVIVTVSSGKWTVASPAAPKGGSQPGYGWVACARGVCTVVAGSTSSGQQAEILLFTGSGKTWKRTVAPVPRNAQEDPDAGVQGMTCDASVCTAVGQYYPTVSGSLGGTPYVLSD